MAEPGVRNNGRLNSEQCNHEQRRQFSGGTDTGCRDKQHEHGELFHTLQQLKAGDQLLIIVGCEGGFDGSEIQELNEMGVKCCSLGNRILRSETAPLYLMSVIGYSRELTK